MKKILILSLSVCSLGSWAQSNHTTVNTAIDANIYTNETHKITATIMNSVLKTIGNSALFMNGANTYTANTTISQTGDWDLTSSGQHTFTSGSATFISSQSGGVELTTNANGTALSLTSAGAGDTSFISINCADQKYYFKADGNGLVLDSATSTRKIYSGALLSIASPSVSITGTSVRFPNAGTPGANKIFTSDASGYGTWQTPTTLTSGTYTYTITEDSNLDGSTAYEVHYYRIGDDIHVYGAINFDATTTGVSTVAYISLPIASDITTTYQVAGTFSAALNNDNGQIIGDTFGDRAMFTFQPVGTADQYYSFEFTYHYQAAP